MLGQRSAQWGMFEADTVYADFVGKRTFYGYLASQRGELFRDADFAALYCPNNGRPSVPPSLLATALVLQTYDGVSDDEAKQRADYDLRWKVAPGIALDVRPFVKSTLQEFRAQLIVHDQTRAISSRVWSMPNGTGCGRKATHRTSGNTSKWPWIRRISSAVAPSRTRTTCWRMASSRCCGRWPSSDRLS